MARNVSFCSYLILKLTLIGLANPALAYKIVITEEEFMTATDRCKKALASKLEPGQFKYHYQNTMSQSKEETKQIWKVGGWHYCGGVVKLSRAKLAMSREERHRILNSAINDINYSFVQIDHKDPWAAEMATSLAEAYMELEEWQASFKILDNILTLQPTNSRALSMYGLVHYRKGNFGSALEYFEKANEVNTVPSAQITYFMGLAALKMGNLKQAQIHAEKAEQLGYPLSGLKRLLSQAQSKPQ